MKKIADSGNQKIHQIEKFEQHFLTKFPLCKMYQAVKRFASITSIYFEVQKIKLGNEKKTPDLGNKKNSPDIQD